MLDELSPLHRQLRRAIPEAYKGFGELHRAAFADGALDVATKELIALAIAVVEGCDGCIASHAQAAAQAGATRQQAAETIGVTFLMHGGPATSTVRARTTPSASSHPRRTPEVPRLRRSLG